MFGPKLPPGGRRDAQGSALGYGGVRQQPWAAVAARRPRDDDATVVADRNPGVADALGRELLGRPQRPAGSPRATESPRGGEEDRAVAVRAEGQCAEAVGRGCPLRRVERPSARRVRDERGREVAGPRDHRLSGGGYQRSHARPPDVQGVQARDDMPGEERPAVQPERGAHALPSDHRTMRSPLAAERTTACPRARSPRGRGSGASRRTPAPPARRTRRTTQIP